MMISRLLMLLPAVAAATTGDAATDAYASLVSNPPRKACPTGWRGCDLPTSIRLFPGDAPDEHDGFPTGPENYVCNPNGTGGYGPKYVQPLCGKDQQDWMQEDVKIPTITPFLVDGADAAMIIAPGGGYTGLAVGREGTDLAAWLNDIGVSAFVLKYRVPQRPWTAFGAAPLQDAQRSMGLVREMIANETKGYASLNTSKLGFMGFSAGSHLTGHLNVAWQKRTYKRIDAADDQPCKPGQSIMIYPWESVPSAPVHASREQASSLNVTSDTPTTMIVQAEDDPVHMENALFYYYALKTAKAAASELHIYPRGGHGYGRCTLNQGAAKTFDEVCTWPDRGRLFLQTLGAAP